MPEILQNLYGICWFKKTWWPMLPLSSRNVSSGFRFHIKFRLNFTKSKRRVKMRMVWKYSTFVPTTLGSLPSSLKSESELPKDEFPLRKMVLLIWWWLLPLHSPLGHISFPEVHSDLPSKTVWRMLPIRRQKMLNSGAEPISRGQGTTLQINCIFVAPCCSQHTPMIWRNQFLSQIIYFH